ncbi:protease inhibitor [Phage NC-G]|nr:protease inhibitor [Phage NC-G]
MSTKIEIGRHKGRLIEHSLYELSDSRKLPDLESDLIKAAADYIHWLEAQLRFADKAF